MENPLLKLHDYDNIYFASVEKGLIRGIVKNVVRKDDRIEFGIDWDDGIISEKVIVPYDDFELNGYMGFNKLVLLKRLSKVFYKKNSIKANPARQMLKKLYNVEKI